MAFQCISNSSVAHDQDFNPNAYRLWFWNKDACSK